MLHWITKNFQYFCLNGSIYPYVRINIVVNLAAQSVDMLSSISLTRGKRPSNTSIRLSAAITKAFHAFLLQHNLDIGAFTHVYPNVFGKKKG